MRGSSEAFRASLPAIERTCVRLADDLEFASFVVACVGGRDARSSAAERADPPDPPDPADEERWARAGYLRRSVGRYLLRRWPDRRVDFEAPEVAFRIEPDAGRVTLEIAPVFWVGRYRKLARGFPQTRWLCRACRGRGCASCGRSGRRYAESVEERIAEPVRERLGADRAILHAMGREDIDARMLGNGRPFVLEVRHPRRRTLSPDAVAEVRRRVAADSGGDVEISPLRPAPRAAIARFKEAAATKSYVARVRAAEPLPPDWSERVDALAGAEILQDTPRRVRHRRAVLQRRRRVLGVEGRPAEGRSGAGSNVFPESAEAIDSEILLAIRADAGLYVKELISGDDGRTRPSVAGCLGVACTCLELDVTSVEPPDDCRRWLGEELLSVPVAPGSAGSPLRPPRAPDSSPNR